MTDSLRNKKLVFLMSFGHCGIDWVHSLLEGHPQVLIMPAISPYRSWKLLKAEHQTNVEDMYHCWMQFLEKFDDRGNRFLNSEEEWRRFRDKFHEGLKRSLSRVNVFWSLHEAYAHAKNMDVTTVRTVVVHVHVCFSFTEIVSDFDDYRILMIVRDPRAAMAGYFRGITRKFSGRPDYYDYYCNYSFEEWMQAHEIWKTYGPVLGDAFKVIKNEDLHQDLRKEMEAVSQWMEIEFRESMLHSKNPDGSLQRPDSCYISNNDEKTAADEDFFHPDNVRHRWMEELSDSRELLMVETIYASVMHQFGYDRLTRPSPLSRFRGICYFLLPHRGPQRLRRYAVTVDELDRVYSRFALMNHKKRKALWKIMPHFMKAAYIHMGSCLGRVRMCCFPGQNRWRRYDIPGLYAMLIAFS